MMIKKFCNKLLLRVTLLFAALATFALVAAMALQFSYEQEHLRRANKDLESLRSATVERLSGDISRMGLLLYKLKLQLESEVLLPDRVPGRAALEAIFPPYFSRSDLISQLRWLNAAGEEQARVNRRGGQLSSPKTLQNKAKRYYVVEALAGGVNDIYTSPIDLNIENEQIEKPYKPTIRLLLPTRGEEGGGKGLLVMNLDLTTIFDAIYRAGKAGWHLTITDDGGRTILDTLNPEAAWQNLAALSLAQNTDRQIGPEQTTSAEEATTEGSGVSPLSEPVGGLLGAAQRYYYVDAELSEAFRLQVRRDGLVRHGLLLVGLLLLVLGVCAFVYRYERRQQQLNRLLYQQVGQLQRTSHFKTQFLANMSHEIRTPLTALIGLVELMTKNPSADFMTKNLPIVEQSARSLMALINDILDASRLESGHLQLEEGTLVVERVLSRSMQLFNPEADRKLLTLITDIEPILASLTLHGDALRLSQVINNLVGNAVKFTERGSVTLRACLLEQTRGVASIEVEVVDTGVGLSEDLIQKITTVFEEGHVAVSQDYSGSGLGLIISQQLLGLMGSRLDIESKSGKGSRFHFVLNLQIADHGELNLPTGSRPLPSRVLILESDGVSRRAMKRWFEALEVTVLTLSDSSVALRRYQEGLVLKQPFQLVIADIGNDDQDGLRFLRDLDLLADRYVCERARKVLLGREAQLANLNNTVGVSGLVVISKPVTISRLTEVMGNQIADVAGVGRASQHQMDEMYTVLQWRLGHYPPPSILVVDDNHYNQVLLEEIFASFGLQVDMANDGQAAVDAVDRKHYDLIYMDLQMPVMDGYSACEHIRKCHSAEELPIVAVTAANFPEDRQRSRQVGMNDHLPKPIQLDRLLATILKYWHPEPQSVANADTEALKEDESNAASVPLSPAAPSGGDFDSDDFESIAKTIFADGSFETGETVYPYLGAAAYLRVAEAFVKGLEGDLQKWREAGQLDPEQKRKIFHKLRGATGSVGAVRLASVNARLSEAFKNDPDVPLDELIDEAERCIKLLRAALHR